MKRLSFSGRVNPDSGPTVSRRSALPLRYLCATLVLFFSLGIGQMWATNAAVNDVLWSENFGHFGTKTPSSAGTGTGTTVWGDVTITYTQSSTNTKGYNENLASGTAPELLLAKSNTTWTISGIPTGGATEMALSFLSNKTTFAVTTTTANLTISGSQKSWTITVDEGKTTPATFDLTIKNTGSSNARLDNVSLVVVTAAAGGDDPGDTPTPSGDPAISANPAAISDIPAAGVQNQTIDLTYENIENYETEVTLHSDAEGTEAFTGGWLTASVSDADNYATVTYSVTANDGVARTAYIKVYTTDGDKDATTIIPVSQAEYVAPFEGMKLDFALSSNPGGWPTTNSTTITNYTYTLESTAYTFALKNVKCNNGYLMLTATAALGLPAVDGYKLVKIEATNSSGCSKSTSVSIKVGANSSDAAVNGGAAQTFSSTSSTYTYNLTGTAANTMYYLYVTSANCQLTSLSLYYEEVEKVYSAVTITNPAHGTISVMYGEAAVANNTQLLEGSALKASIADVTGYRFTLKAFKTGDESTVVTIDGEGNLTMPAYPITITADETALFAISVAVNDEEMGTATINGGASFYTDGNDVLNIVATANPGYEFVNWTASSDDLEANEAAEATTTATAIAAGTLTANFQALACTSLPAPTADEVTKTYNSATIAWSTVDNADGYLLTITKHEDGSAVLTDEVIVAPEVSFEKTGLEANTQYDYTVMAVGDGIAYCDENNALLASSFTTDDYPAATLSLVENGGTPYNIGSNLKMNDVIALPTELAGLGCSGKVLAGWSSVAVAETDEMPASNYWAAGAEYTLNATSQTLYAVLATAEAGDPLTITLTNITIKNNASGKSSYGTYTLDTHWTGKWMINNTSNVYSLQLGYNTDKTKGAYNSHLTVADLPAGATSVHIETQNNTASGRTFYLCNADDLGTASAGNYGSGSTTEANGSVDITVFGAPTTFHIYPNGTAYIKTISVNYGGSVSYSGYTTSCTAALPTLDAPTFSLEAGSYYDALQTVTLTATDEADIYYTLDGSEPSTSSTKYTEAIALAARGEYTIKAIAAKEGFETSEIATRAYNIVLPYDFADFVALDKSEANGKEFAVRGIISQKGTLTSGNQLPYYISADGQTEGQIKCHNGLKLNKETFTSADDVNLGDNVTVVGTWSSSYENLNAGNWMLEYTPRAHASYAIEGDLTAKSFDDGDAFDDAILANLTVKETFNTGYYANVAGVTFNAGEKTAWADGDTELTVYAVLNEETIASKTFTGITVSSAALESIALKADDENYSTKVVYYLGEDFVVPTIVATLDDASSYEAAATLVSGFDNENAEKVGTQEVTVSYTRGEVTKTVSYNITMKKIFDNEEAPHTVAEANALINAHGKTSASSDYMWVRGIVSGFKGTSNNQYYISDDGTATDQLYVYNGKYFNNVAFTESNKLHVGDVVILKTKMQIYSNAPELSSSVVVYQLRDPEFAFADITAEDAFEANVSEDLEVVPTANSGDVAFTLSSTNEAVVTIVDGKLHAVAEGDAVITATRDTTKNENAINYKAKETTFNVHVIAERTRYAVTFDANGGTGEAPVIADQLAGATVELPTNPYSKENGAFAAWVVLETVSGDTVTITDGHFTMPAAAVTIKATWDVVATCVISFQIGGNEVATANAPQTAEYTFTQVGAAVPGFTFLGWSETEISGEVEELPTLIASYTPEVGEGTKILYGIYSRVEGADETNHYVLDYAQDVESKTLGYGTAVNVTATDGSEWVVKVAKNQGMQVNTGKNASIKIPDCPADIVSIAITGNQAKAVGLSATDYNGSGTITYIVQGTDATSQTLSFTGLHIQGGYIVAKSGTMAITHIDVEYSAAVTYYTSTPVEKVKVTFNTNGGEGGCAKAVINNGGQLTICADVPTKEHSEFAGWKNGDDVYEAGQAYTFNADITLTAQWNTAAKYTVTYAKGGDDVTGSVPTDENSPYFAGDSVTVLGQGGLEKSGYEFQGWLNGNKLHAAGAKFAMPAENVTLTAQWRKEEVVELVTEKMMIITDASALVSGMEVALGCSYIKNNDTLFAMAGDLGGNKYFASVASDSISLDGNIASITKSVIKLIAEQVENGWKLRKDAENYLTSYGNTNDDLKWEAQANATVWTISFSAGNVTIMNSSSKYIQYNSSSPRFKTYGSSSNMTAIQLFGKAIVVAPKDDATEPVEVNISDLGYVEEGQNIVASGDITLTIDVPTDAQSITAKDGATVVIDAPTTTQSVNVEEGSKIEAQEATTTPIVNFATTLGADGTPSTGSALGKANNITLAAGGEIHYDITLGVNMTTDSGRVKAANQWHAFTVPFPVNVTTGIYNAVTGAKLTNNVDYAIMDYHGDIRANGEYGWKRFGGTLVPGVFYIMTINGDVSTFRFKMSVAANTALQALNSMAYTAYIGSGESSDQGWNGIGNPSWVSVTLPFDVQVLDPKSYEYMTLTAGTVISASTPFFYKAGSSSTMMMTESSDSVQYAPRRTPANGIKNMAVSFGNEFYKDKLYVSASEDALNEYEQDKDLVKMRMSKAPKVAQIFGEAYGMKLCMVNAPMTNNNAEVALDLYAPAAGEYTISVPAIEGYTVYLVREGSIIWNLTTSEYTADFDKGNNAGYSIRIVRAPMMPTDLGNIYEGAEGVQKVVIDDHVYILRNEKMYDVTGKMVK